MDVLRQFADPAVAGIMVPIAGILVGGIIAIVCIVIKHRERMAMIEQGIHPDHPEEQPAIEHEPVEVG